MRQSAIISVLALVLAGMATVAAQQDEAVVDIRDFAFEPHEVELSIGTAVRWVNRDSAPHSIAMEGGRAGSSGVLEPGQEHAVTLREAGRFTYRCGVHPTMLGVIVVD